MRLTPAIAVMILVDRALASFMMNEQTPPEFLDFSVRPCEENWWMTLLHINGFARSDEMVRNLNHFDLHTIITTNKCFSA
jgi:hypothetical protein